MPLPECFFLVFSGGEVFLRRDFYELLEHARSLLFSVKVKTNAIMIGEKEADRLAELGLHVVQVSVNSQRPEVHDRITMKYPDTIGAAEDAFQGQASTLPSVFRQDG